MNDRIKKLRLLIASSTTLLAVVCIVFILLLLGKQDFRDGRLISVSAVFLTVVFGATYLFTKNLLSSILSDAQSRTDVFTQEVQARKSAEASLVQSERRFRVAAQAATDLIYEWDVVTDTLSWYGDIDKALGYANGEFPRTLRAWLDIIHPDDKETLIGKVWRQREQETQLDIEYRVRTRNGDIRIWKDVARAICNQEDRPIKLIGACTDITDKRRCQESLEHQARLFNSAFDAMINYDLENTITAWNGSAGRMYGYSEKEVLGEKMHEVLRTKFEYDTHDFIRQSIEQNGFWEGQILQFTKDDEALVIHATVSKLYDNKGKVIGYVGSHRDITKRVEAEKALEEEKQRAQEYLDIAGTMLVALDKDGNISMINRKGCEILGWDKDELTGKNWFRHCLPVSNQDQVSAIFNRLMSGEIDSAERVEADVVRKDGCIRRVAWNNKAVRDKEGRIIGTLSSGEDVTEQRRAAQKLYASTVHLFNALRIAKLGHWQYDVANDEFTFNDEFYAIFKTSADVVGGYTMSSRQYAEKFVHPEDAPLVGQEVMKALQTTDPDYARQLEHRIVYADGSIGYIAVRFQVEMNEEGKVVRTYGINQDISEEIKSKQERQRLEDQLRQSQKLETIGTLAGGIAHDFNNILVPILVTSQILLDEAEKDTQMFEDVEQINTAAKRARDLVKHILAFSRQNYGECINIDLTQIVKEVAKLLQGTLPSSITLNYYIDPDCGRVEADPTQIHQVLMNLCTNAYQAIGENEGKIDISLGSISLSKDEAVECALQTAGEFVTLSVKDTGCGMTSETLEHVFDPFFTTKEVGKGTGLGLSVAHGIAKNHGGTIVVHSEPGKGSAFTLFLPKADTTVPAVTIEDCRREGGKEHILVVDDDYCVAQMAQRILKGFGYRVTIQTSAVDCVEAFKANPGIYDIILTDQIMPIMTGDRVIKLIHEIRQDIPAVVMTGFSTTVTEENYQRYGFDEFILKPMVPYQLNNAIRNALDRAKLNI